MSRAGVGTKQAVRFISRLLREGGQKKGERRKKGESATRKFEQALLKEKKNRLRAPPKRSDTEKFGLSFAPYRLD